MLNTRISLSALILLPAVLAACSDYNFVSEKGAEGEDDLIETGVPDETGGAR